MAAISRSPYLYLAKVSGMKFLVYILVFLSIGCGRTTNASNSGKQTEASLQLQPLIKPENDHVIVGSGKRKEIAFSAYKNLCLSIENTTFHQRDQVCQCTDQGDEKYKFTLVKSRRDRKKNEARCEQIQPLNPPDGFETFAEYLKASGASEFKKSFENISRKYRTKPVFKFGKSLPSGFLTAFANSLDANPLYPDIPQYYGLGGNQFVHIGYGQDDAGPIKWYFKRLSTIWGNYSRTPAALLGPKYSLFVRSPEGLSAVLGVPGQKRNGWNFPNVPKDDENFEELNNLRIATAELNEYLFGGGMRMLKFKTHTSIIEEGCHLRCFVSNEFKSQGRSFRYEKMYIYGEIVAARLLRFEGDVLSPGATYSSMVYFGKNDAISAVVVNRRNTDSVSAGWVLDVYDEKLEKVYRYDETRIESSSALLEALAIPNDSIESSTPVVLLEGILDYRDFEVMKWIKKGPYRSKSYLLGGSVFGWKNAGKGDSMGYQYSSFYDGLFTDDLDNPSPDEKYYHANIVGRQVLGPIDQNYHLSLIPTSSFEYTNDRMADLYRIVRESGARVINYSAIVLVDGANSCPLNDTRLSVDALWVLGAGNDGLEDPTDTCEQNLEPKHRRLVVAANAEDSLELEYYSDFGRNYADLSAGGVGYDRYGNSYEGTSFAAPKVSHTAATIINRYGSKLSNQLVRLAILLSVDVDVYSPMSTRSGGRLNKDNAIKLAGYMSGIVDGSIDFPYNLTKKQIMARLIRASGSLTNDDEIAKQVEWLVSNGI